MSSDVLENPNGTGQGFRVDMGPIDDRTEYDTIDDIFTPSEKWIHPSRRYDGLLIYIKSERKCYRFVGGIERKHFIPDPSSCNCNIGDLRPLAEQLEQEGYLPLP